MRGLSIKKKKNIFTEVSDELSVCKVRSQWKLALPRPVYLAG